MTPEEKLAERAQAFSRDGYVIMRSVFGQDEIGILREAIVSNERMNSQFRAVQAKFESGKYPSFETICVWNDTSGDDLFAKFTRAAPLMNALERIFEDDVY